MAIKVPEITALFWVTKLLTTALGEAASDYLVRVIDPVIAVGATFLVFAVAIVAQLLARRYRPWLYWATVTMVAVFGTMAADVLHVALGVPYLASSVGFAVILAIVLVAWQRTECTLDMHSIHTTRRELFYWATVSATFALGTAAGDLFATVFHLGYAGATAVFALAILVPLAGFRFWHWGAVGSFWFAYILTRPLGASVADWFGMERTLGGLGIGHGPVALVLVGLTAGAVGLAQARDGAMTRPASRRNAGPATSTPSR
ncbi:hypothetical protein [Gryllotalpicola protaetiae]|uniref:Membrane-anchored protein n=1 Tax=Gryllotalpicola protaetiae TaxID=2419771 RepID=A0A387BSJ7_9MICO|nr:hypothetical protein [Gryllotalpicola protaetiae]AYG05044.1 hypothetical protein D7I44_16975 [Gryllotalpicola protaetiae]